jgi:O-antigen/teichoic acid export membrane protein
LSTYLKILRHTAIYSIAIFVGKLCGFLMLPLYTRYVTPAQYGVLELIEITSYVLYTITALHLCDALFFYYFKTEDEDERRSLLTTAYTGGFIGGAVIGIAGWFAAPIMSQAIIGTPDYAIAFRLVCGSAMFGFFQEFGVAHLRAMNRSTTFVALQMGRLVLQILCVVTALVVLRYGFLSIIWCNVILSIFGGSFFALWTFAVFRGRFRWAQLKDFYRYAFPLAFSGLGMLFLHFGDRFFLRLYVGLSELGQYSLAYKLGMLVALAQVAFVTYWKAQMHAVLRDEVGNSVYPKLFTYYMFVLTGMGVMIAAAARPVMNVMSAPAYHGGIALVPMLTAAYVIRGGGDYLRTVLLTENRPGVNARVTWIGVGVCVAGYIVGIPPFGIWGAALATLVAFTVMFALSFWEGQRVRPFVFEWRRLTLLGVFGTLSMVLATVLQAEAWGQQIVFAILEMLLFAGGLLVTGFAQPAEWKAVRSIVNTGARRMRSLRRVEEI